MSSRGEQWTLAEREAWKAAYRADEPVVMPLPEHGPGECDHCDTIRALMAEVDSEGEESRMHTEQSRMVRASLEATAHPDVYARRKVADRVAEVVVEGAADVAIVAVDVAQGGEPLRPDGRERVKSALASVAMTASAVVQESGLRAPVAEVEGDHDDPNQCTCPTTQRDADGNCDLLEQDDCPVHGAECICATREINQRCPAHGFTDAGLPDSADSRLHGVDPPPGQFLSIAANERMADLGRRRQGWRGRLAHIEMLLAGFIDGRAHLDDAAQALAEVRALIDEG